MKTIRLLLLLLVVPSLAEADMVIGGEIVYRVVKGDTIEHIGAKLGVNWRSIVKDNGIDIRKPLRIGQEIRADNRKIIPKKTDHGIIINIPDKTLYYFKEGELVHSFPVGLGRPSWMTPEGKFAVISKQKDPTWYVPKSIQREMKMKGDVVKDIVPPGPDNPLGRYSVKTSLPGILIHETIWPTSVYQYRSHGCIRVLPGDMEEFFNRVEISTSGEILYITVKVAVSIAGRILLEVNKDIYGKIGSLDAEAKQMIINAGLEEKVDWQKVDIVVREKSGIPEDITL